MSSTPQALRLAGELERAAELRAALRRFLRRTEHACAGHGLDPASYDLLLLLEAAPGDGDWALGELGERLALDPAEVETALASAELLGLVEREDVVPGAVARLRPSEVGRRRLAAAFSALDLERDRLLAAIERADARLRALGASLEPHEAYGL